MEMVSPITCSVIFGIDSMDRFFPEFHTDDTVSNHPAASAALCYGGRILLATHIGRCLISTLLMASVSACDMQQSSSVPSSLPDRNPASSRKPDLDTGTYSLTSTEGHSELWNCRARQIQYGAPASQAQMKILEAALVPASHGRSPGPDADSTSSSLGASWNAPARPEPRDSEYVTSSTSVHVLVNDQTARPIGVRLPSDLRYGDVFRRTTGRLYSIDEIKTLRRLKAEFGSPSSIIRTSGEGCRIGSVTMIYTMRPNDSSGASIQVGEMCQAPPITCALEAVDPCSQKKRLPEDQYAFININAPSSDEIKTRFPNESLNPKNFTGVTITFFDPAVAARGGYPRKNPPRELKPCGANNPFYH